MKRTITKMMALGGAFARLRWPKSKDFTIADGLCEERSADGVVFRNIKHGDLQNSMPRPAPTLRETTGPMKGKSVVREMRPLFQRQLKNYAVVKKVAVDPEGNIFRATDDEIIKAISVEPTIPPQWTAEMYVTAVKRMLWKRS